MPSSFIRRQVASIASISISAYAGRSLLRPHFRHVLPSFLPTSSKYLRSFGTSPFRYQHAQVAEPDVSSNTTTYTNFADLSEQIHDSILSKITGDMGLTTMTEVQEKTLTEALTGKDIVGQAKTGTGKTIAFLLPMAQRALVENPNLANHSSRRARPDDILGIVISPTRELAEQIHAEAKKLMSHTGLKIQLAVGGTQKRSMLDKARREGCHILVGTPGRIQDLLEDDYSGIKAPRLNTLVLDEADRLLDVGFGPAIEAIKAQLPQPREKVRQNMLFSATISREVVDLVKHTLQPGFKFVQCVDPLAEPTHENVTQKLALLPGFENRLPALLELVDRELKSSKTSTRPFKAMIFYNSTAETQFVYEAMTSIYRRSRSSFNDHNPFQILHIHGQLSQAQRTRVSEMFRKASSGILITTDVTARGLDFPNVTHVIQIGVPVQNPRESYIHRLGRTARAGKEGEGWLFVTDIEAPMAKKYLLGLPLQRDETLQTLQCDLIRNPDIPSQVSHHFSNAKEGARNVQEGLLRDIYINALRNGRNNDRREVVKRANFYAKTEWGYDEPPGLSPRIAGGIGLSEADGVRVDRYANRERNSNFGNRRGSNYGGGASFSRAGGGGFSRSFEHDPFSR